MSQKSRNRCVVVLTLLFALFSSSLIAQSFFGGVVGTVTDNTGAVVSNATITLTNTGTNEKRTANSDAAGNFRFVSLVPAVYKVDVQAPNFKRFMRDNITVQVENTVRVDAALTIGETTETVEVTSQAPLLQTESGSLGSQVEGKTVAEMPLNGRNTMNLVALVPGVIPQGSSMGTPSMNQGGHTGVGGWGNYQIGGGLSGQSASYFDGAPTNVLSNNVALIPTQDAVQEFKVATNSVSAEFGRFAGGVVEMTSKSGSNAYHGSAYEYLRNKVLNANDFFSNLNHVAKPKFNQNQFGVMANAPIKKDKIFGFFSWEHFSSRIASPNPTNVPTAAMQSGIVSGNYTDPSGRCPASSMVYNAVANTTTIAASCIDGTAKVLKQFWPEANSTSASGNYFRAPVVGNNANQYNGRVDWNVSANQRIFARFTSWRMTDIGMSAFGGKGLNGTTWKTSNAFSNIRTQQGVIGDTITINPTTILDVRASYTRHYTDDTSDNMGADMSQFGPAYAKLSSSMTYQEYPGAHLMGKYNLWPFWPLNVTDQNWFDTYVLSANLTKILGRHTLKAGMENRLMDNTYVGTNDDSSGQFQFTPDVMGDEWVSFLLGIPTQGQLTVGSKSGGYVYPQGYYLTDVWQASSKLTINMGLRWELLSAIGEKHDKATVLLPNVKDPYTGITGTLSLVNQQAMYPGRTTQLIDHRLLAPRFGFAYRLSNSTAIRGGYGLTFVPPDLTQGVKPANSSVNSATSTFRNSGSAPFTFLSDPFPAGVNMPTGRSNPGFMTGFKGMDISGADPYQAYGYNQQWNLTVGRQFARDLMVEAGYVGAKGTHLSEGSFNIDQLASKYFAGLNSQYTDDIAGGMTASAAQADVLNTASALRPYGKNYTNVTNTNPNLGSTSYHSMQLRAEKRFKNGGLISGNYVWSKLLGNTDSLTSGLEVKSGAAGQRDGMAKIQNYNDLTSERSILSFNIPQRAVISYVLPLPFGKGQKYGANLHGVANALISGWAVNGITSFQSGTPLYLYTSSGNMLTNSLGGGTLRPNVVAGCSKSGIGSRWDKYTSKKWFNTSCFTTPTGFFAMGNESRVDGSLKTQGTSNFDLTAMKSTKVYRDMNLQFRAEFFNIFNHTQFAPPVTAVGSQDFGKIMNQANQQRLVQLALRLNF